MENAPGISYYPRKRKYIAADGTVKLYDGYDKYYHRDRPVGAPKKELPVEAIRARIAAGETRIAIAAEIGCSRTTLMRRLNGE